MLAHLYGTPAKLHEIKDVCKAHGAILIEDAAEALGSTYHGRACGTFGNLAALSLVGVKVGTGEFAQVECRYADYFCTICTNTTLPKAENWFQTGQPGEYIGASSGWLFC